SRCERINRCIQPSISGKYVGRNACGVRPNRHSAQSIQVLCGEWVRTRSHGLACIEDFTNIRRISAAIECDLICRQSGIWVKLQCRRGQVQEGRKITADHWRRGNDRRRGSCLPYSEPFVVAKKESAVLNDRPTERKSKLILFV